MSKIEESLRFNPLDPFSHIVFGNCIKTTTQDYKAAIKEYRHAAELCSKNFDYQEPEQGYNTHATAYYNTGVTYHYNIAPNADEKTRADYLNEAIKYYNKATEIDPKDFEAHLDLAKVFSELYSIAPIEDTTARISYLEQSGRHYLDAIQINPKEFEDHLAMAGVFADLYSMTPSADVETRRSYLNKAGACYEEEIRINPKEFAANLGMAWFFSQLYSMAPIADIESRRSYLNKAAKYYEDAIKINPEDFAPHLNLARVYVRLSSNLDDEYALQGLRSFEQAQKLNQEDYSTNFELASFIDTILRKNREYMPVFFDSASDQKDNSLLWIPLEEAINIVRICYNKALDIAQIWPDSQKGKESALFDCCYGLGSFLSSVTRKHFNYLSTKYSDNDLEKIKQDAGQYLKQAQEFANPGSYNASIAFHALGFYMNLTAIANQP